MTSTTTATVETLTAEVRVLMVGSRQITLSVARQLDYAPYDDIEPMGRVRIGPTSDDDRSWVTVIGRHRMTGALTMAMVTDPTPWEGVAEPHDEKHRAAWLAIKSRRRNWPEASTLPLIVLAGLR